MYGQTVTPSYYRPPPVSPTAAAPNGTDADSGTTHESPHRMVEGEDENEDEPPGEWILLDGTPASAVQIGLNHYCKEQPPHVVISGPNFGRNTTACFALSSGTLGAAMEAATCGVKAIALSFAYFQPRHSTDVIQQACRHAAWLVEQLCMTWPEDTSTDLFSINVPLCDGVENVPRGMRRFCKTTGQRGFNLILFGLSRSRIRKPSRHRGTRGRRRTCRRRHIRKPIPTRRICRRRRMRGEDGHG